MLLIERNMQLEKKCKVNIFVEHDVADVDGLVTLPNYVEHDVASLVKDIGNEVVVAEDMAKENGKWKGKEKVVECEDNGIDDGGSSSDDDVRGITLDDSEEERGLGLDDGFNFKFSPPMNGTNRGLIEGKKYRVKKRACKRPTKEKSSSSKKAPNKKKSPTKKDARHRAGGAMLLDDVQIVADYVSDELGSSDPDDSDTEKGPEYERFRMEHMHKKFKFKIGMEFSSLKEFKDAIIEWTVINGYECKFLKNDKERCRAVCKSNSNCEWKALCSEVGGQHTYKIKTLGGDHTCARTLENISATSKWVTKAVLPKMMCSDNIRVIDILTDMRRNHGVGITFWRGWKTKMQAREIIDGDSTKQYSNLWRYAAEIKRACDANSVKINVVRSIPTLQPKFGSFYFCFEGCKQGFLNGCRPFIGVDGCHLKTQYGGQLLIAVERDANDQYYPLAFGIVEVENTESWRWFLTLLLDDIGTEKRWVFISNQQKVTILILHQSICLSINI